MRESRRAPHALAGLGTSSLRVGMVCDESNRTVLTPQSRDSCDLRLPECTRGWVRRRPLDSFVGAPLTHTCKLRLNPTYSEGAEGWVVWREAVGAVWKGCRCGWVEGCVDACECGLAGGCGCGCATACMEGQLAGKGASFSQTKLHTAHLGRASSGSDQAAGVLGSARECVAHGNEMPSTICQWSTFIFASGCEERGTFGEDAHEARWARAHDGYIPQAVGGERWAVWCGEAQDIASICILSTVIG